MDTLSIRNKKLQTIAILAIVAAIAMFISSELFAAKVQLDKPASIPKKIQGGNLEAKKGGVLTYEFYEPDSINPINFKQAGSAEILIRWVFETLVTTDIVTGDYIPSIAKNWAVSKDGKTFTFWIDDRAKFADGKPITAEDVKFSFEVFGMDGADSAFKKAQLETISSIEIVDQMTIKFTAKEKLFSNFEFIVDTLILPKHLYYYKDPEKLGRNEYTKKPQGSGPYYVESWAKGDKAVLVKNKNYWAHVLPQNKGAYNFDKIVIKYIRDPQIAFENLKKGNIDYMPIRIGNTELWRQTKTDKSFTEGKIKAYAMSSKVQQGFGFVGFNLNNELFKDKKVRKALCMAINREELIVKSLDGLARVPFGPLFSVDNTNGSFKPLKYDVKGALKLMNEAGWKDTNGDYVLDKGGKPFKFNVIVPNARIEKEMLFIQSYWKQIGVDATVKILEYSTWRDLQDERKFDALANGRTRSLMSRSVDAYGDWHSDNAKPGLGNYYSYSNPTVDKLIIEARQTLENDKRKKILDKVNDILAEDHVVIMYSESSYSLHALHSYIGTPDVQGKIWFPYDIGMKYWWRK